MPLTLIDPTGQSNQPERQMAARLSSLQGKHIALLSNGKLNAELLLRETAACFNSRFDCQVSQFATKPFASKPAEPDMLIELAKDADLLITANGD